MSENTAIGFDKYFYVRCGNTLGFYVENLYVLKKTAKNLICTSGTIYDGKALNTYRVKLTDNNLFTNYDEAVADAQKAAADKIESLYRSIHVYEKNLDKVTVIKEVNFMNSKDYTGEQLKL